MILSLINLSFSTSTAHDDGVILSDDDLLGLTEDSEISSLKVDADLLADELTASSDGNVLHGVASVVSEPG